MEYNLSKAKADNPSHSRADPSRADNPSNNKEDSETQESIARELENWVDCIQPGSPAPAVQDHTTITTSEKSKPSGYTTHLYATALRLNHIYMEAEVPSDLNDLAERMNRLFTEGDEDGTKSLLDLNYKVKMFHQSLQSGVDEGTLRPDLEGILNCTFTNLAATLANLRQTDSILEVLHLQGSGDKLFRSIHYDSFPAGGELKVAKPDAVMGYSKSWLKGLINTIPGSVISSITLKQKVWEQCEICDQGVFFPYFICEFKSQLPITDAVHQLRGACAAALASGIPWIAADNVVFALAANGIHALLYVAWMDPPGELVTDYHFAFVESYTFQKRSEVQKLQHTVLRIHLWAAGERRLKIEKELESSMTEEMTQISKRRDGTSGDEAEPDTSPLGRGGVGVFDPRK